MPKLFSVELYKDATPLFNNTYGCRDTFIYYAREYTFNRVVIRSESAAPRADIERYIAELLQYYPGAEAPKIDTAPSPFSRETAYTISLTTGDDFIYFGLAFWIILVLRLASDTSVNAVEDLINGSSKTDGLAWYRSTDRDTHITALRRLQLGKEAPGEFMHKRGYGPINANSHYEPQTVPVFVRRRTVGERIVANMLEQ